jgi:hypothetical protein
MDLSVVLTTLMKLPASRMSLIKAAFPAKGLGLSSFLRTMLLNVPLSRQGSRSDPAVQAELLDFACNLTDFFQQVSPRELVCP